MALPDSEQAHGGGRVLIVDDDTDVAESLQLLLAMEGYDVALAADPPSANRMLDEFAPDLALIDVRLKDISGIALMAALHERRPDLLCVVMTAYASIDTAVEALHAGAYDYLRKPLHSSDLLNTLRHCFERVVLARQKAAAEEALRLRNEELERINRRLQLVVDSMRGLTNYATLKELCPRVLEEVAVNMAADGGSVYVRDGDHLVLCHALDPGHAPLSIPLPLTGNGVFAQALESRQPVLISEIEAARGTLPSGWSGYEDRSLLAFPLLADDGEEFGVLSLHTKAEPPFTPQDRDVGLILISFACETMRAVKALEELSQSEERFRSLVESCPVGIYEMTREGQFLSANRAGLDMLALACESDWRGRRYLDFIAPADRGSVGGLLELAQQGRLSQGQFVVDLQEGQRHFSANFAPLSSAEGGARSIVAIAQDVTERHHAEERLRQSQKMEAVGQLTGGIAHDFNNLLQVILGNAYLVKEDVAAESSIAERVETMSHAALRGSELTSRLLAFSRQQPLQPETVDLYEVILGMRDMLVRALGETVHIETHKAAGLWLTHADPGQVENAVLNLAINARQAMPDGGRLTISVSNKTLPPHAAGNPEGLDAGDYVVLRVSDTGEGMSAAVAERAFEPFFTTKEVGEGSGLGLSMVYGFAQQSGGRATIDSAEGAGARVSLYLPRARESRQAQSAATTVVAPRGGQETILVVEDDPDVRSLSVAILKSLGYDVLAAADGASALLLLEDVRRVDLLLTDAVLVGGMSGAALIREIRRRRKDMRAVMMTGYAATNLEQGSWDSRPPELLMKPFTQQELASLVRAVLDADVD